MKNNIIPNLSESEVIAIRNFINSKNTEIEQISFNKILRDDVFVLLENYCIIIYFPKEDEDNNGFNVKYYFNNEVKHFVYINTAQYKEKQVFTAAHELGHIWNILSWMEKEGFTGSGSDAWNEKVINRFAAELLMPEKEFNHSLRKTLNNIRDTNNKNSFTIGNMIQLVTALMNEFLCPFKSVVYRLYELNIIQEQTTEILLSDDKNLETQSIAIAQAFGYNRIYRNPDKQKWIIGLKEMLDKAKNNDMLPEKWIDSFYILFDFDINIESEEFKASLPEDIILEGESDA
ncbi:MAG: ImmA/IrrE family metallo-endopeptidase [Oscillospiraceae bacterium]|nr:ImmA/IrrE family metallo-endopeptidase [Oscillospiraceae bacterium]